MCRPYRTLPISTRTIDSHNILELDFSCYNMFRTLALRTRTVGSDYFIELDFSPV